MLGFLFIGNEVEKNTAIRNSALNAVIIILAGFIIYLVFSIFMKLSGSTSESHSPDNHKTASDIIQVDVLNGCGIPGTADVVTEFLRRRDYDVVRTGNYLSFDVEKTLIIDRIGNNANALKVAEELGLDKKAVIRQINEEYFLDVTVVLGKDYQNLKSFN